MTDPLTVIALSVLALFVLGLAQTAALVYCIRRVAAPDGSRLRVSLPMPALGDQVFMSLTAGQAGDDGDDDEEDDPEPVDPAAWRRVRKLLD